MSSYDIPSRQEAEADEFADEPLELNADPEVWESLHRLWFPCPTCKGRRYVQGPRMFDTADDACYTCRGEGGFDEKRNPAPRPMIAHTSSRVEYPRVDKDGNTVWACCESRIGPVCCHRKSPE